jgi:hypothetical protein
MLLLLPVNINLQCKWLGTIPYFNIIKATVSLIAYFLESPAIKEVVVSAPEAVRARNRQSPSLSIRSHKPVATRARNSQEPHEFFCSHSITFNSWTRKRMLNQLQFSLRILTKRKSPQNKAAIFKSQILFIERSAVIEHEGDYQFFSASFLPYQKFSCRLYNYIYGKEDSHFSRNNPQSQSQSSDHRAVINCMQG